MSWTIQNFDDNGFAINPVSFAVGGAVTPGQTRWVYNFNGVDSYIQLSPISYSVGDLITFKVLFNSVQPIYTRLVGGSIGNGEKIQMDGTGTKVWMSSATYEVISIDGGDPNKVITDGVVHTITVRIKQPVTYSVINSNNPSTNNNYFTGFLFDYTDSLGNNLPINDRTFGVGAPIANGATVLGSDLPTNDYSNTFWAGTFDQSNSGDGFFVTSGGGLGPRTSVDTFITGGNTYLINASNLSSGVTVNIRTTESGVENVLTSDGVAVFTVPSGDTGCQLYVRSGSAGTHTANVSVREANGYATGVNLLESGWEEIPL